MTGPGPDIRKRSKEMDMNVKYSGGMKFSSLIRGHQVEVDLPETKGGENSAPTPPELCVFSLGTCIGVYAVSYLKTAKLDPEGVAIDLDWTYSEDKKRIARIKVDIEVPNADSGRRKKALIAAVRQCVIHNTLKEEPDISISVK
ncbi:MAG: hypothetical protein GF392_01540 [Candidatus Omnitrophica bacterium]|nr:hypothetical protein [Candidatus Omnitrophota bacterium]